MSLKTQMLGLTKLLAVWQVLNESQEAEKLMAVCNHPVTKSYKFLRLRITYHRASERYDSYS